MSIDSSKAYTVLGKTIYTNIEYSAIVEPIMNAVDSHISAGKSNTAIDIDMDGNILSITDYGIGIPGDKLLEVYTTLLASSKEADTSVCGKFGLGSKCLYYYNTGKFSVVSTYGGIEITALFELDSTSSIPKMTKLLERATSACNGVNISFEIDPTKISYVTQVITALSVFVKDVPIKPWFEITDIVDKTPPILKGTNLSLYEVRGLNSVIPYNMAYCQNGLLTFGDSSGKDRCPLTRHKSNTDMVVVYTLPSKTYDVSLDRMKLKTSYSLLAAKAMEEYRTAVHAIVIPFMETESYKNQSVEKTPNISMISEHLFHNIGVDLYSHTISTKLASDDLFPKRPETHIGASKILDNARRNIASFYKIYIPTGGELKEANAYDNIKLEQLNNVYVAKVGEKYVLPKIANHKTSIVVRVSDDISKIKTTNPSLFGNKNIIYTKDIELTKTPTVSEAKPKEDKETRLERSFLNSKTVVVYTRLRVVRSVEALYTYDDIFKINEVIAGYGEENVYYYENATTSDRNVYEFISSALLSTAIRDITSKVAIMNISDLSSDAKARAKTRFKSYTTILEPLLVSNLIYSQLCVDYQQWKTITKFVNKIPSHISLFIKQAIYKLAPIPPDIPELFYAYVKFKELEELSAKYSECVLNAFDTFIVYGRGQEIVKNKLEHWEELEAISAFISSIEEESIDFEKFKWLRHLNSLRDKDDVVEILELLK